MLKIVVLFVTAYVILGNAETKKTIQLPPEKWGSLMQGVMQCAGKLGVSPADVLKKRDRNNVDETTKKFIHCAFTATGVANQSGDIKVKNFLDIYPNSVDKEELRQVIKQCEQSRGAPEDKIHNFLNCYKERSPVLINFLAR